MEEALIMERIRGLYKRYRHLMGLNYILSFLFYGIIVSILFGLFVKITGFYISKLTLIVIPPFAAVTAALVFNRFQGVTLLDVALKCDEKLMLKERLSTALEWIDGQKTRTPMFRGLLRDTAKSIESMDPRTVFPIHWKKPLKKLMAVSTLLVLVVWAPPLSLFLPKISPQDKEAIRAEARRIEALAKKIEKKEPKTISSKKEFKKTANELKKLSKELDRPEVSKREALAKISETREKLQESLKDKEELRNLEDKLRKATASGGENDDKAKEDSFRKMSEKLQNIASRMKDEKLSPQEKEKLMKEMQNLKEQMEKAGMNTEKIEKAMENAKQGSMSQAAKDIEQLGEQFSQRQNEFEDGSEMQDASSELEQSINNISGRQMGKRMNPDAKMKDIDEKFPGDFGDSSTNKEEFPEKDGENKNIYTKRFNDKKFNNKEEFEQLYQPEKKEAGGYLTKVSGKLGKGEVIKSMRSEQKGAPPAKGHARVDPTENYLEYRALGEEAVKKGKIPSQYKDLVREYYNEINPEN